MLDKCDICGEAGLLFDLGGQVVAAALCVRHHNEFDGWLAHNESWKEDRRLLDELSILTAHAAGGMDLRAKMLEVAERRRELHRRLREHVQVWIAQTKAELPAKHSD